MLDFGLAKAFQPEASDASVSMSPTISLTAAATQMGMVIGTAAYMAPEQAKGLPFDKRAIKSSSSGLGRRWSGNLLRVRRGVEQVAAELNSPAD